MPPKRPPVTHTRPNGRAWIRTQRLVVAQRNFLLLSLVLTLSTLVSLQNSMQLLFATRRVSDALVWTTTTTSGINDDDDDDDDNDNDGTDKTNPVSNNPNVDGILSTKDVSFFRDIQATVDDADAHDRCRRYGATYNATHPKQRRIFFGALIASEPLELLHIVSTEVYGIYSAMVLVEGNRTQNFTPRPWKYAHSEDSATLMANLFGVDPLHVQTRPYVNERGYVRSLAREHDQRAAILQGWRELGMTIHDVGLLADMDETLTRDFLRAVQTCDGIHALDYDTHSCHHSKVKLIANGRAFEASPECIPDIGKRSWYHPDLILGHCIEGIGGNANNSTESTGSLTPRHHRPAPRMPGSFLRAPGFGKDCTDWDGETNMTDQAYPLWNAADFRRTCGGHQKVVVDRTLLDTSPTTLMYDRYTGYHFHNFFAHINNTRFKYHTYGHSDPRAHQKPIYDLSRDMSLVYDCVMNRSVDVPLHSGRWKSFKYVVGGYNQLAPYFRPIYFHDDDYRRRRHDHLRNMIQTDMRGWKQTNTKQQKEKSSLVAFLAVAAKKVAYVKPA